MIELKIEGATCQGCVNSIEKAIKQVSGVTEASFSLDSKIAKVDGEADRATIADAVEMAGFDVVDD